MKRIILLGLVLTTSFIRADDTPFLSFSCEYDRALEEHAFRLRFKNDDSVEVESWSSALKRTKMRFEKVSKTKLNVWISTGLPVVAHAVPEEFRFTAPLSGDDFQFSFGMKPLNYKNEFFSLVCRKITD